MNWVDLAIIILILIFVIDGARRGFFIQLIEIVGFVVSLIASLTFYPQGAAFLLKLFNLPKITAYPLGFLLVWIVTETAFFAVASPILGRVLATFSRGKIGQQIDKFLGFIPSTANALLFAAFILLFTVSLPIAPDLKKDIFGSRIGSQLVNQASTLERPLNSIFGPIARQSLTFLTVTPQERSSIDLQFTQKEFSIDSPSEQRMFELVNGERIKFGVKPLVWNQSLAQVGRNHSKDMFERGYFSHYSPEDKDVGDRLTEAGINFTIAGENLALAPDVTRAHTGLMNSPGHRRNILDPAFGKIGIGVIDGGIYGKMFTQVFTN